MLKLQDVIELLDLMAIEYKQDLEESLSSDYPEEAKYEGMSRALKDVRGRIKNLDDKSE